MQTIYADGIANITFIDGVVRLDLVNITRVENGNANIRPAGAVAMSLQALIRTHGQLSQVIDKLVADGILKKAEAPEADDAGSTDVAAEA